MAKRSKDDLGAALGALINPPAPGDAARTGPGEERAAEEHPGRDVSTETVPPEGGEAEGYARTSTGYRRESGEVVRRLSLFLTERQRRELRRQAVDAGAENVTEYVVNALGLDRGRRRPPAGPP